MDLGGFFWNYYILVVVMISSLVFYYHEKTSPPVLPYSRTTFVLYLIVLVLTTPLQLLLLALFGLYRQLVAVLLSCKLGPNFGGVLEGNDALYAMSPRRKAAIAQILFVRYRGSADDFFKCVRKQLEKSLKDIGGNPKTFSRMRSCLGYYYWVRGQKSLDGYVTKIDEESILDKQVQSVSKEESLKIVNVLMNKPLENLWHVFVSTKYVEEDDGNCLMLFIKYNHVLGDPISLSSLGFKHFGEKTDASLASPKITQVQNRMSVSWLDRLCLPLLALTKLAMHSSLFEDKDNPLRGPELSHEVFAATSYTPTPDYVEKIKKIKNFVGCTFMDVVLAAVSASFSDYIQKKRDTLPSSIAISCSEMSLLGAKKALEATSYGNYLGFSFIRIPIYPVEENGLLTRVRKIQICTKPYRNPLEIEILRMIRDKAMHVLPSPLIHFYANTLRITTIVTNVPDATLAKFIGDVHVSRVLNLGPLREKTGIMLCLTGCRGLWQVSPLVDRSVISDEKEVIGLAEGVHKYVEKMYQECALQL